MRRSLIVGNWKMHGSTASVNELLGSLKVELGEKLSADVAVCPPCIFITQVAQSLKKTGITWGAQSCSEHSQGAFTGEVSAAMLADLECRYVIVGHSERRALFAEDDQLVAAKFLAAQAENLIPILCVGESLEQREAGDTLNWVEKQLNAVINAAGVSALIHAVVAYEPVWAIGTGKTATPDQAQDVHAYIRQVVANADKQVADSLQILYGGSVKADNATELFRQQDIDGALVGGASLKADDFAAICKAAS